MQLGWQDDHDAVLAASIFGTSDFQTVCNQIVGWVYEQKLGKATQLSIELSVGAAIAVTLDRGPTIFVKAWPPLKSLSALAAQIDVQRQMQIRGFPAPKLLSPIKPLGSGVAVAMEHIHPGETVNARQPSARRAMAQMLSRLITEAEDLRGTPDLPCFTYPPTTQLWPKPHSTLFDFNKTSAGAEWIDDVARISLHVLQQPVGRSVLGHNDWSALNLRWHDSAVTIVYDWDSMFLGPETAFVGTAAANFPASWQSPDTGQPNPDDMRGFVKDYAEARGKSFTDDELVEIAASINYTRAYTARCEHATDPDGGSWRGSAREALQLHGLFHS